MQTSPWNEAERANHGGALMASLITHPVIPLAVAVAVGRGAVGTRLLVVGCAATLVADLDVFAFALGIPYAAPFGHRGFTHSIAFGLLLAVIAAFYAGALSRAVPTVFGFVLLAALSHPLLDACTNGGLGVALAWPFSDTRMFAPWRPIEVSPIGVKPFFTPWGGRVLLSELLWIWVPAAVFAVLGQGFRKMFQTSS